MEYQRVNMDLARSLNVLWWFYKHKFSWINITLSLYYPKLVNILNVKLSFDAQILKSLHQFHYYPGYIG